MLQILYSTGCVKRGSSPSLCPYFLYPNKSINTSRANRILKSMQNHSVHHCSIIRIYMCTGDKVTLATYNRLKIVGNCCKTNGC
jgi:hypothetical protein